MRVEGLSGRLAVDYPSVIAIAERIGEDPAAIIEQLEAIARGYAGK